MLCWLSQGLNYNNPLVWPWSSGPPKCGQGRGMARIYCVGPVILSPRVMVGMVVWAYSGSCENIPPVGLWGSWAQPIVRELGSFEAESNNCSYFQKTALPHQVVQLIICRKVDSAYGYGVCLLSLGAAYTWCTVCLLGLMAFTMSKQPSFCFLPSTVYTPAHPL